MQNISAHDAKARFGQLLDTARREPVVIERHDRAVAVVLSKEEYDELNDIRAP
ncbi:type II toxin-antitoxin system Phd/YefM family antitoxin [Thiococcus pfennigii]|jgi:prevent-host-death family protein|uniref:type II toxin-antitoxin system Phd/YefM family antitoxin n=1 Tax=Thiococcus pfennigii TaxID=1057 RepID=UPI001907546D|nr:type II toxin-antitoxin system Phd/YefM family antitoxin [Thiococcus pfennigii]MBK1702880.1 type II toxin-antitoxin system prevent-host-death family antitoxin [Thiococcus pfennigii]MBK1733589.1 type II toxin-antitoxin system prevent-host-death family antitoxin [Thiococcus pfennigii]